MTRLIDCCSLKRWIHPCGLRRPIRPSLPWTYRKCGTPRREARAHATRCIHGRPVRCRLSRLEVNSTYQPNATGRANPIRLRVAMKASSEMTRAAKANPDGFPSLTRDRRIFWVASTIPIMEKGIANKGIRVEPSATMAIPRISPGLGGLRRIRLSVFRPWAGFQLSFGDADTFPSAPLASPPVLPIPA